MQRATSRLPLVWAWMAAMALSLLSGCQIYFGPDDGTSGGGPAVDAGPPSGCGYEPAPLPPWDSRLLLRDPITGQCVDFNWNGDYDPCQPGPGPAPAQPPPWGQCESECSAFGYDEAGCLAAPGCRAAYAEATDVPDRDALFLGCWAVSPVPPADPSLACEELSPMACSMRDDCSAVHFGGSCYYDASGVEICDYGPFEICATEPSLGCTDDSHCRLGMRCDMPTSCVQIPECASDPSLGCADGCAGTCVPVEGSCNGEVLCDALPPSCPPNMVAGRANGCWTGFCLPVETCPPTTLDCGSIETQDACLAEREACTPVYGGLGCTCDDSGCTCQEWVFEGCRAR